MHFNESPRKHTGRTTQIISNWIYTIKPVDFCRDRCPAGLFAGVNSITRAEKGPLWDMNEMHLAAVGLSR